MAMLSSSILQLPISRGALRLHARTVSPCFLQPITRPVRHTVPTRRSCSRGGRCLLCLSSMSEPLPIVTSQPLQILAANPDQLSAAGAPVGSFAAILLLLTGLAVWRFTAYGQLQYITAAMLGRWVPKGSARVIQVGGGSRDLYYYPKDTVLVTAMSPKLKKGLMGQAAIQAGVPVDVRLETPTHLSFQGNSSVEAVVCLQSLHTLPDLPRFLAEAQRVLKPGAPFIFLQAGLSQPSLHHPCSYGSLHNIEKGKT
ncbi:TPA: hypothetical protein ACH3X3_000023 [Trebouxia sp. C0006]